MIFEKQSGKFNEHANCKSWIRLIDPESSQPGKLFAMSSQVCAIPQTAPILIRVFAPDVAV